MDWVRAGGAARLRISRGAGHRRRWGGEGSALGAMDALEADEEVFDLDDAGEREGIEARRCREGAEGFGCPCEGAPGQPAVCAGVLEDQMPDVVWYLLDVLHAVLCELEKAKDKEWEEDGCRLRSGLCFK